MESSGLWWVSNLQFDLFRFLTFGIYRSVALREGQTLYLTPGCTLKVTNAAIGGKFAVAEERTTLLFQYLPAGTSSPITATLATFVVGVVRNV